MSLRQVLLPLCVGFAFRGCRAASSYSALPTTPRSIADENGERLWGQVGGFDLIVDNGVILRPETPSSVPCFLGCSNEGRIQQLKALLDPPKKR